MAELLDIAGHEYGKKIGNVIGNLNALVSFETLLTSLFKILFTRKFVTASI